jgi:NADPH-dependent curcumin reductase CurA
MRESGRRVLRRSGLEGERTKRKRADSKDPTMRNWLNAARSYMRPIEIGESMRAAGIGRVVASKSKSIAVGDLVSYLSQTKQGEKRD